MRLRVYVAAPFARRDEVRALHGRLEALGMEPTSQWALGTEREEDLTVAMARALAVRNDDDVARSHALLMTAYPGEGGESFGEARLAIEWRVPVIWVGRRTLSTFRRGVVEAANIDQALSLLHDWELLIARPWLLDDPDGSWARSVIRDWLDDQDDRREAAQ